MIAAIFFVAAFVKGTTGLGFSTVCLPFLVYVVGLKAALPLLIVPSLASNILVMQKAGYFRETISRFWLLFVAAVPGLFAGLWLLNAIDTAFSSGVLGAVIVGYCIFALTNPLLQLPDNMEKPLSPIVGFSTGFVNGLTGSQIIPILPFLLSLKLNPNRLVQTINCSFTLSSLIMAAGLANLGLLTFEAILISTLGILFVQVGIHLGSRVRKSLKPEIFRAIILIFLMLLGASLIVRLFNV